MQCDVSQEKRQYGPRHLQKGSSNNSFPTELFFAKLEGLVRENCILEMDCHI